MTFSSLIRQSKSFKYRERLLQSSIEYFNWSYLHILQCEWNLNNDLHVENHFWFSYIVWYKKGYQEFQEPRGTSVIKVKGVARVDESNLTRFVRMLRKTNYSFLTERNLSFVIKEPMPDIYGIQPNTKYLHLYVEKPSIFSSKTWFHCRKIMLFLLPHDKSSHTSKRKAFVQA